MRPLLVGAVGVGDVGVGALAVELPAVERAADLAALDDAAVAQVGAEVRAERVLHVGLAAVVAPDHQVAVEVVARPQPHRRQFVAPGDLEPTERDGEGVATHRTLLPAAN